VLIPYASAALDKAWTALASDFADSSDPQAAAPTAPVRVEIYEEIADLARVSTLTLHEIETSGTIALCKWNRLMIVSPKALLRGYPWLDTLTHEYTHYIVSRAGRGQVPLWVHEGLAKFEEKRWRGPSGGGLSPAMEQLLSTALQKKRLISFEQMSPSMAKLPSQEDTALAFAEVYTFIEYLHGRAGFGGIRSLIRSLADGLGEARAMQTAFGVSRSTSWTMAGAAICEVARRARIRGRLPKSCAFASPAPAKQRRQKTMNLGTSAIPKCVASFAWVGCCARAVVYRLPRLSMKRPRAKPVRRIRSSD
jgi:hypothetical protein